MGGSRLVIRLLYDRELHTEIFRGPLLRPPSRISRDFLVIILGITWRNVVKPEVLVTSHPPFFSDRIAVSHPLLISDNPRNFPKSAWHIAAIEPPPFPPRHIRCATSHDFILSKLLLCSEHLGVSFSFQIFVPERPTASEWLERTSSAIVFSSLASAPPSSSYRYRSHPPSNINITWKAKLKDPIRDDLLQHILMVWLWGSPRFGTLPWVGKVNL